MIHEGMVREMRSYWRASTAEHGILLKQIERTLESFHHVDIYSRQCLQQTGYHRPYSGFSSPPKLPLRPGRTVFLFGACILSASVNSTAEQDAYLLNVRSVSCSCPELAHMRKY